MIVTFLSYLITLGYSVDVLIVRVLSHLLTSIDLTLTKELHTCAFVVRPSYCDISIPIDSNCYICYLWSFLFFYITTRRKEVDFRAQTRLLL